MSGAELRRAAELVRRSDHSELKQRVSDQLRDRLARIPSDRSVRLQVDPI